MSFASPSGASADPVTFLAPAGARTHPDQSGWLYPHLFIEAPAAIAVPSSTSPFSVTRRLRLANWVRRAVRHDSSLGLVLVAGDPQKIKDGGGDDTLSYQVFTVHR